MKFQILIEILFLLLTHKKVSASYIAENFNISIRTVFRYIQVLELASVPILSERGKNGGFSIPETYKLPASFLTREQYTLLQDILSAHENQPLTPEITALKQRFDALDRNKKHVASRIATAYNQEKQNNSPQIDLVLEVDKGAVPAIKEWLGNSSVNEKDGKFFACAKVAENGNLCAKLLSFGKSIKIIYPKSLQAELKKQAESIIEIYSNK